MEADKLETTEVIYDLKMLQHCAVKLVDSSFSPSIECLRLEMLTPGVRAFCNLTYDKCIAKGHHSVKGTDWRV